MAGLGPTATRCLGREVDAPDEETEIGGSEPFNLRFEVETDENTVIEDAADRRPVTDAQPFRNGGDRSESLRGQIPDAVIEDGHCDVRSQCRPNKYPHAW